jgi:hypothetical protein
MTKRVPVVNTEDTAARVRETFHDSPVKKRVQLAFGWPKSFTWVGRGWGVIYWSDKWKTTDTYKHKREGEWDVYFADTLEVDGSYPKGGEFRLAGAMPKHVAYIGKFIGLQLQTLKTHKHYSKPAHLEMKGAHWAAAKIPSTGETVLIAYDAEGIQILITGKSLDVEKDGIVG